MQETDDQLVDELANGSRVAFTTIYNNLFYKLFNFSAALVGRSDAEDICADLFTKLWERRQADWKNIKDIECFLMVSVRNACLNHLRGLKRRSEIRKDYIKTTEQIELLEKTIEIRSQWMEFVIKKVGQLPDQCQKIFRYAYLDGLTNFEIAGLLNIAEKTVSNQKTRALQLLKQISHLHIDLCLFGGSLICLLKFIFP